MKKTFLALFMLSTLTQAAPKTVYLSSHFATQAEAQQALRQGGFFLFDIHGVLFKRGNYVKAFKKMNKKGKFIKQALAAPFSKKARAGYKRLKKEGNEITERTFDAVAHKKHLHNELIDFANNIFSPNQSMYRLLLQLKDEGHELYLLSNIGNETFNRLVQQHAQFFGVFTDARNTINRSATEEAKNYVWKPQQAAFIQALQTINKADRAHFAIFVDDSLEHVIAAQKAGMNAIHFTSYAQLLHDIAQLLKA